MAEIITAIGAIAAVAQMAEYGAKASLEFYDFLKTIKNAPREIVDISRDIEAFHKLVLNLQASLSSSTVQEIVKQDADICDALKMLEGPIANCCEVFKNLMEKLRPHLKEDASLLQTEQYGAEDKRTESPSVVNPSRKISRADMKWYFRRREVYSLITQLERTKVTFADAMGSITLLLTLKSSALTQSLPEYASSPTYSPNKTVEKKFDNDVGTALEHFAETASTLGYAATLNESPIAVEAKQPELQRKNSALTKLLMQSVKDGLLTDTIDALKFAHVDSQDQDGRTALSWAAELGRYPIAELLIKRHASVSLRQYSNQRRAPGKPNSVFTSGRVPLHWAAAYGRPGIVGLLLRNGANPNARSTTGRSALEEAAMHNHIQIVKTLLNHGADVNARSYNHGWTAMHEAAFHGNSEIVQLLSEHGAWLDPLTIATLNTPLHHAVARKQTVVAQMLLDFGSDPNSQTAQDIVPIHIAAAGGWVTGLELLLKAGAWLNARDALLLETPLHKAARNLQINAIDALRRHGANEEAKNVDGQTYREILDYAREEPEVWCLSVEDPSFRN